MDREDFASQDRDLIWKEQGRREICKTPVFTVTERHSVSPDGLEGDYIVNEAKEWVIVVPDAGDSFLMVKQWRHGEKALSIEFPGGVVDQGESPDQAAIRELKEETGCTAGKMIKLGCCNPNPALFANHFHVYLAQELEYTNTQELDADEYLNYMKISKDQVIENMCSPEYPHGLMGTAMFLYLRHSMNK